MRKGNAVIGQSGGPTSVINASLAGAVEAARDFPVITGMYGMRWGIEGFLKDELFDFAHETEAAIRGLKTTPSSACGSCRYKLKDDDLPKVLETLRKYDIRYLFLVGGNDTMDTVHRVEQFAEKQGYALTGIGIPKTVDNDLFGTDHTPGYPSAARYMALSVLQAGILARDMQKVDQFTVFQTIGRDGGWLAAATAAAKKDEADAPHIILLPERAFDKTRFLAAVKKCHERFGFVSVVCGEGIAYPDGTPVSASRTTDKFSNIEYGAMAGTSAAMMLHGMIAGEFGFRGEFQVTESLSMCAADRAVEKDIEEAYLCGREAVRLATAGQSGVMVTLVREPGGTCRTGTIPLAEVAIKTKPLPDEYINSEGASVTAAFLDYLRPLVGPMPDYVKLSYKTPLTT